MNFLKIRTIPFWCKSDAWNLLGTFQENRGFSLIVKNLHQYWLINLSAEVRQNTIYPNISSYRIMNLWNHWNDT